MTTSLFYSEEAEVDTRSPEKDVEVFKSTCSDIRQTMLDIKSLKDKKAVSSCITLRFCCTYIYKTLDLIQYSKYLILLILLILFYVSNSSSNKFYIIKEKISFLPVCVINCISTVSVTWWIGRQESQCHVGFHEFEETESPSTHSL